MQPRKGRKPLATTTKGRKLQSANNNSKHCKLSSISLFPLALDPVQQPPRTLRRFLHLAERLLCLRTHKSHQGRKHNNH